MSNSLISIILGILVWVAIIAFFFFITNKLKYKTIISKIIVLAIIIFEFYKIFNGSLEQFNLGILNGAVILGLTWGTIFAVHSTHIFNTLEIYFICCLFGWLFSFGLGCLEFGNIPFEQSMRTATLIGLGISYSKIVHGGFFHNIKLDFPTDDKDLIYKQCLIIFDRYYEELPIRKVSIAISKLSDKDSLQLNIFENYEEIIEKDNYNKAIDEVRNKYGKNSLLTASSLLKDSTIKERNKKIGGHSA